MSSLQTRPNHLPVHSAALSTLNTLSANHFECSICLGTFKVPNVIPECLHRFCDACIKESIHKCGTECPACRTKITSRRDLRKDKLVGDIVSQVKSSQVKSSQVNISCSSFVVRLVCELSPSSSHSFDLLVSILILLDRWTKFTAQLSYWNAWTFH